MNTKKLLSLLKILSECCDSKEQKDFVDGLSFFLERKSYLSFKQKECLINTLKTVL